MKLWLISQTVNCGYDTYDSAVVAATDEGAAREMHPTGDRESWKYAGQDWVPLNDVDLVKVELIGEAVDGTPAGAICASFNAA